MILIAKRRSVTLNYKNLVLAIIKENYFYLFLGFLIIITIAIITTLWFIKANKSIVSDKETKQKTQTSLSQARNYIVKEGDNLWQMAELAYGSGFNAVDIAKINNIADPNLITIGQKLVLPVVQARTPTRTDLIMTQTKKVTFTGNNYLVKEGDYLWKIAIEVYGDGYAWTKIANANNLINPDLIYPKSVLVIPR